MGADQGTSLGWVGVGRMGRALVIRLLEAGHEVSVYNRTREKAADLEQLGATIVDAPADLADRDIVFTMVAGSADVEEVVAERAAVARRRGSRADRRLHHDLARPPPSASVRPRAAARHRDARAPR